MKQKLLKLTLLLCILIVGGNTWAEEKTSTLTFTTQCKGSGTADDDVAWTVTSDGTESTFDKDKGIHYGTNKVAVQYIKLSTSDIQGTITKVVVNASTASDVTATVGVTVGGNTFGGDAQSLTTSATDYTFNGSAEGEIVVTVTKPSSAAKALYVKSVAVTYTTGGGDTPALKENDLALTGAPVALSFDLYNNHKAQVIQYTTSSTGEVSVVAGANDVSCSVDGTNKTITVTPIAVTNGEQTVTVNQAADGTYEAGSVTFTVTVTDSTPIVTHTATFSVNGATTAKEYPVGADIEFPDAPEDVSGKTFVGWATAAIDGTTDEAPELVTSAQMGDSDVTFYAVFAYNTPGTSTTATDVLTTETFGSPSSYTNWSDVQAEDGSTAVYAGQSSTNNNTNIQLRATSPSGIITTTSGGKVKKVTVTWASGTTAGRILEIYGSNTAYTESAQLYNNATYGTLLGSITYETSTELTITGDYTYLGIKSKTGALYLEDISIEWQSGTPDTYSDYCTTVVAAAVERPVITVAENPFLFSTTATITCATEGAAIQYSFDGENWSNYTAALTIAETTTIYAKATKGNDESAVAQVTATKNLAEPTVTIVATGITNTNVHEGTAAGSLSATVAYNDNAVEGATVTWSSDNEDVATIAEDGAVTLVGAGTVTFTATFAGDDDYSEATATYEMTVTNTDPNAPGTENNPYTVAEACAAIDAGAGIQGVYATGIVSEIVTAYNSQFSNITFDIVDEENSSTSIRAYRCTGSDAENVQVGDVVVVSGNLTKYNDIYEFAQGCELVSLNRPVDTTPSIAVSTTSVEAPAAGADGTIEVTYNNIKDVAAEVFFCDAEGKEATYDWIVAEINEDNNIEYVIDANTGVARTAYLKVYALDDEANDVYSELITISQAAYGEPATVSQYALFTGDDLVEGDYIICYEQKAMNTTVTSDRLQYDAITPQNNIITTSNASIVWHIAKSGDYWTIYNAEADAYAASTGAKNKAQMLKDGTDDMALWTVTGTETYDFVNKQNKANKVNANLRNNGTYGFACYATSTGGTLSLYKKVSPVTPTTLTLNASGFATFASTEALDFTGYATADYKAWQATSTESSTLKFTQITSTVKAGTGILITGTAGATITLTTATEGEDISATNLLVGFTVATEVADGEYFGLSGDKFVKVKAGTVPAGKALLPASVGTSVKSFSFAFEGNATGIKSLSDSPLQGETIVNLAGQRLQKMQKGINIVNGKKVLY